MRTLAVVCALLWSVAVVFYTQNWYGKYPGDHLYGVVGCIANCALWMGTLASAFFMVVVGACQTDEELNRLINIYGKNLTAIPLMFCSWGIILLFGMFILFYKNTVDSGITCTICLSICLLYVPLFFHGDQNY